MKPNDTTPNPPQIHFVETREVSPAELDAWAKQRVQTEEIPEALLRDLDALAEIPTGDTFTQGMEDARAQRMEAASQPIDADELTPPVMRKRDLDNAFIVGVSLIAGAFIVALYIVAEIANG